MKKIIVAVGAVMSLFMMPTFGHATDDGIGKVLGKAYGEWSAKWWQWAFASDFVQFGDGDVDCSVGQKGALWYLAASFTGKQTRTCDADIPAGKVLFFPLVNYGFWNPDDSCTDDPGKNCSVAEKRKNANGFFSDKIPGKLGGSTPTYACQLRATVDGVPVQDAGYPIVRTQSPTFPIKDDFYGTSVDDPKTISDGYWVAVPPLAPGAHVIKFQGGLCNFADSPQAIADGTADPLFLVNVTYHLTVGSSH